MLMYNHSKQLIMGNNKINNENRVILNGKWNSIFWCAYLLLILICFVLATLIGVFFDADYNSKRTIAAAGIIIGMAFKGFVKQVVYKWSQK